MQIALSNQPKIMTQNLSGIQIKLLNCHILSQNWVIPEKHIFVSSFQCHLFFKNRCLEIIVSKDISVEYNEIDQI